MLYRQEIACHCIGFRFWRLYRTKIYLLGPATEQGVAEVAGSDFYDENANDGFWPNLLNVATDSNVQLSSDHRYETYWSNPMQSGVRCHANDW
ncbi:hypothetical protein JFU47_29360 [Pseudomonas sp. TH39(2020)]|uniref:hypothetical protein n=1 Tax=Pseudomonas sp. TH39(2020) TaxID=2796349 RepID=UPI0019119573|nr:hypothetical protein [Pseudomonas sp. TH39(2020)]MBK5400781.1 hypothetical protein [Pseudomonas sp. TH39(2020)]